MKKQTAKQTRQPQIIRYPKHIWRMFLKTFVLMTLLTLWGDAAAFILQMSKTAVANGAILLGVGLLGINYARKPFENLLQNYVGDLKLLIEEAERIHLGKIGGEILMLVKGRVISKATACETTMTSSNILQTLKSGIDLVWKKQLFWLTNGLKIASAVIMLVGFFFVTNIEIKNQLVFYMIAVTGIVGQIFFTHKRHISRNKFRAQTRQANLAMDDSVQELLNVDPINEQHASFLINAYIQANQKGFDIKKVQQKLNNKWRSLESVAMTICTLAILALTLFEGGINNITLETMLSAIAIITIYEQLKSRACSLIDVVYNYKELKAEENIVADDLDNILKCYKQENTHRSEKADKLVCFTLKPFRVSYPVKGTQVPFTLYNEQEIKLLPGDFAMFQGTTGAGKTTLLNLFSQNLRFDNFTPDIETEGDGTAKTLIHQTFMSLGNKSLISELTLGEENYDKEKLLYILDNLHLLEEFSSKSSDVLQFLASTAKHHFSAGQLQRLAIARTLYNISDEVQIVAFDESTSNLNDDIALQVLRFIKEYCKDRLVLYSTHQVGLCRNVATKELLFSLTSGNTYSVTEVKN